MGFFLIWMVILFCLFVCFNLVTDYLCLFLANTSAVFELYTKSYWQSGSELNRNIFSYCLIVSSNRLQERKKNIHYHCVRALLTLWYILSPVVFFCIDSILLALWPLSALLLRCLWWQPTTEDKYSCCGRSVYHNWRKHYTSFAAEAQLSGLE